MIEVFKIIHNIYDAKVSPQLMLNERANTRGNNYKLVNHTFHCNLFSARIVNIWSSLLNSVVEACSINAFKACLDKIWSHQNVRVEIACNSDSCRTRLCVNTSHKYALNFMLSRTHALGLVLILVYA